MNASPSRSHLVRALAGLVLTAPLAVALMWTHDASARRAAPRPRPAPAPPAQAEITYAPEFTEPGRFTVRNVNLAGQGPVVHLARGGVIEGTLDVRHDCPGCGGAINQVIVGLGGEAQAQACVYNGGARTRGFRRVQFQLRIPNRPGTYEVRARYAQAYSCERGALGWWRVDRPQGPAASSNIGVVIVDAATGPTPPDSTGPAAGELIRNGSFEEQRVRGFQVLSSIPGWTRSAGSGIEVQRGVAGRPADGAQLVELDGNDSTAIYQDIRTVPGTRYVIRVAFSARPGTAAADNRLAIRVNGAPVARLRADGTVLRDTQWTYATAFFVAEGTTTRIELADRGTSNSQGTYIDAVSVREARGAGRPGRRGQRRRGGAPRSGPSARPSR